MKRRNEAGFSLIEVLVAIAILAAVVLPTCSALVLSVRMNERTDELMRSQLAVSSAVETLMAEGITGAKEKYDIAQETVEVNGESKSIEIDRFPDVTVRTEEITGAPYFKVIVTSNDALVSVTTTIRKGSGS